MTASRSMFAPQAGAPRDDRRTRERRGPAGVRSPVVGGSKRLRETRGRGLDAVLDVLRYLGPVAHDRLVHHLSSLVGGHRVELGNGDQAFLSHGATLPP